MELRALAAKSKTATDSSPRVQEINHRLEELEGNQQRLNQLREPPAHPTTQ